jgi:hypothetical protein
LWPVHKDNFWCYKITIYMIFFMFFYTNHKKYLFSTKLWRMNIECSKVYPKKIIHFFDIFKYIFHNMLHRVRKIRVSKLRLVVWQNTQAKSETRHPLYITRKHYVAPCIFFWRCNPLFIHKIKISYKLRTNRPYRTEKTV